MNSEIQKSNLQIQANELDELDNEVAMISQKSPKSQPVQTTEETKTSKPGEKDDANTRNFNSIPRNYNDNSDSNKVENVTGEGKKDAKGSTSNFPLASITICGAKGIQSKINLIPLFNIKSLFLRNDRLDEALEIEYM